MIQNKETIQTFRHAMRHLEAEIGLNLSSETGCCGVTVAQCHFLLEASCFERASLGELADSLSTDKSTLSRTLEALVKSGYIQREENPENRRKISISLTEAGAEKVHTINNLCDGSYAEVFSHIPNEKHDQIIESVSLLAQAMYETRKTREKTCCREK